MPAAAARERRARTPTRAKGPAAARPAARGAQRPAPNVSKLRAAQGVGLAAPVAGAVAALLALLILVAALATGGRAGRLAGGAVRLGVGAAEAAAAAIQDVRRSAQGQFADLGLRVDAVHLQGASPVSQAQILRAAAIRPGAAILGLDLGAIRARVERVGWVEHAKVIRLLPDTLVIAVTERRLAAVWQVGGRLYVVAADGAVVSGVDPEQFPGLPRLIGVGANTAASALLPRIAKHPTLASRLGWLRRVDRRRWDLILKDRTVIALPEADPDVDAALARLDRLDRRSRVLTLGVERIDLRDPAFTVVRPRVAAPAAGAQGGGVRGA
jgi:cell division protein FtsQ